MVVQFVIEKKYWNNYWNTLEKCRGIKIDNLNEILKIFFAKITIINQRS